MDVEQDSASNAAESSDQRTQKPLTSNELLSRQLKSRIGYLDLADTGKEVNLASHIPTRKLRRQRWLERQRKGPRLQRERYWQIKGPHAATFENLRPKMSDVLSKSIETTTTHPVLLSAYLVGREASSAKPVIGIICEDDALCKQTMRALIYSNVLDGTSFKTVVGLRTLPDTHTFNIADIQLGEMDTSRTMHTGDDPSNFEIVKETYRAVLGEPERHHRSPSPIAKPPMGSNRPTPGRSSTYAPGHSSRQSSPVREERGLSGHVDKIISEMDIARVIYAEDDRQSVRSANSSMTAFTTLSGKTAVELEGATVELQNIFQERATLVPLYRRAIKDEVIGPERLRRNVGRLLKTFAQDLRLEAGEELERMTCRFVSTKASYIAHCIVEDLNDTPLGQLQRQYTIEHEHVDEIEDRLRHEANDTDDLAPVDEDVFEDLPRLRAFLVNSAAFQVYREELARFVLPKELQSSHSGDHEQDKEIRTTPSSRWRNLDVIRLAFNSLLIATGFLEPPLQPAMTRLRWQCHCGETFFEDVIEYEAGGVSELVQEMLPYCVKITVTAYSEGSSDQAYSLAPLNSLQAIWRKTTATFRDYPDPHGDPSQDSSPQVSGEDIEADSAIPLTKSLLLLAGLHKSRQQIYLSQDSVEQVKTDRQLFRFMKEQLDARHSFRQRLFSTVCVRNIYFNKFYLRTLNNLEVRTHDPCCTGQLLQKCEFIPPRSRVEGGPNAEYRCKPAGPLKRWPPVLSQYLVHRVQDPSGVGKEDVTVLQKIPRRICGKLKAEDDQEAEGWGIYYEEGPNLFWVAVLTTLIASLTALFFGILWATLRKDLQGAFGVSGCVVAVCAATVPLLAWYQNS